MDGHIGQKLGNYRLHRLLGQGGFADVYLAEHIHLRTQAAIKVLQMRLVESNVQNFLNEARTIAHLVHPYIIRVLDFGVEGGIPFLVMDYAPKGTFRQRFLQGNPLPPKSLFPYMKQVASALQYAHDQKLVHRDVKPENMLVGSKEEVLLSDFGLALIQTSLSLTPSVTVGTGAYMAPEQLQGRSVPASDQYALGIIAYEWLTGTCPFQGTFFELASQHMLVSPPAFEQHGLAIPAAIEQVVMTALAKEPSQRFPSVLDFAQALEYACFLTDRAFYPDTPVAPVPFVELPSLTSSSSGLLGRYGKLGQLGLLRDLSQHGLSPLNLGQVQPPNKRLTSSLSGLPAPLNPGQVQPPNKRLTIPLSGLPAPLNPRQVQPPSGRLTIPLSGLPALLNPGQVQPPSGRLTSSLSGLAASLNPGQVQQPSGRVTSLLLGLPVLSDKPSLPLGWEKQNEQVGRLVPTFPMRPPSPSVDMSTQLRQSASVNNRRPLVIDPREQGPVVDRLSSMHGTQQPNVSSMVASAKGNKSTASSHSDPKRAQLAGWSRLKPSSTGWGLRIFVIVMLAVIIGSTTLLLLLTGNQTHTAPVTNGRKTSSTPITVGTSTSSAISNPYGDHNGLLVLNTPLNQQDPNSPWDERKGECEFSGNSYHVIAGAQTQGFIICYAHASNYTNFVYQVQMTFMQISATESSGGLVFRANEADHQFYFFEIFSSGYFAFYRCPGIDGATCPLLSSSTLSDIGALNSFKTTLKQPNTLAIMANEHLFTIYVNNHLAVGPVLDPLISQAYSQGKIGVMARQVGSDMATDVAFSDVKIWQL